MRFSESLKLNHVFRRLYRKGDSAVTRYFVIYCRGNTLGKNRVGFTVGKKLGKAVVRNRVRRRLREIYRLNEEQIRCGYDLVIVARTAAVGARFSAMQTAYLNALNRLNLLQNGGDLP